MAAAATECVMQDRASASFGATPLLLQLATGHYRDISIHTAGNRIGNARGMKADVRIDDVRPDGDADAMGTVGALDAMITWSADGMKQSIQEAIPLLRGLSPGPDQSGRRHHQAAGQPGQCHHQPQDRRTSGAAGGRCHRAGFVAAQRDGAVGADGFTTDLTENYPLDIHADSVQITYDGVTAHYSTRDTSIPQGNQGNQGNKATRTLLRKPIGRQHDVAHKVTDQ